MHPYDEEKPCCEVAPEPERYWVPLIEIVPHRDEQGKVIWELTTHTSEDWRHGNTHVHSTEYMERTFTSSEEALTAIGQAMHEFERRQRER